MLQSQTVYSNVSKGVLAKSKDLVKAFGTDDQTKICLEVGFTFQNLRPNLLVNFRFPFILYILFWYFNYI